MQNTKNQPTLRERLMEEEMNNGMTIMEEVNSQILRRPQDDNDGGGGLGMTHFFLCHPSEASG
jgi:hypothetical protein